jgi:hypothetical protein
MQTVRLENIVAGKNLHEQITEIFLYNQPFTKTSIYLLPTH